MPKGISRQENLESTAINLDYTEHQINYPIETEQSSSAGCLSDTIIKEYEKKKNQNVTKKSSELS